MESFTATKACRFCDGTHEDFQNKVYTTSVGIIKHRIL